MPLSIDIIGGLDDDDGGEELDRRFRGRRDPTKDYLLRDPRNPERYPMGSGGEVNYGLRVQEGNSGGNPVRLSPRVERGNQEGHIGARTQARYALENNQGFRGDLGEDYYPYNPGFENVPTRSGGAGVSWVSPPKRFAPSGHSASREGHLSPGFEEDAVLADLGFFNFDGMGYVGSNEQPVRARTIRMIEPDFDFNGLDGLDEDDSQVYYNELGYDMVQTFFTDYYDGIRINSIRLGNIGKAWLPKVKLPDLKKVAGGVGKALGKVAKTVGKPIADAGAKIVKGLNDAYKAVASKLDITKKKKQQLIADMNQVRGQIEALEKRGLKNPESLKKLASLKAEYAKFAKEAEKLKVDCDKMEKGGAELKASGVAGAIKVGMKAQEMAKNPAKTKEAVKKVQAGKLKGLSDVQIAFGLFGFDELGLGRFGIDEDNIEDMGYVPGVTEAVIVGGISIAVVMVALVKILGNMGKFKKKTLDETTAINKLEAGWTPPTKVPYDPAKMPPTEIIKDPDTGQVLGVRNGDQVQMRTEVSESTNIEKHEMAMAQKGAVKSDEASTGKVANIEAKYQASGLLGKLGLSPMIIAVIGIGAVGVIYVMATSKKKKAPPVAPAPVQTAPAPTG